MALPKDIINLSDLLSSLPGVGPKLSARLALFLSTNGKKLAKDIQISISELLINIQNCEECGNVSIDKLCDICANTNRNKFQILVVEDPLDLYNIESSGEYKGVYHVLGGLISPVNGIGPDEIKISQLIHRLKNNKVEEIIFGLNPNIEGDSTSLYIKSEIEKTNPSIKTSKLAKGIPVGSDIEFMSPQTLIDSMKSRSEF